MGLGVEMVELFEISSVGWEFGVSSEGWEFGVSSEGFEKEDSEEVTIFSSNFWNFSGKFSLQK